MYQCAKRPMPKRNQWVKDEHGEASFLDGAILQAIPEQLVDTIETSHSAASCTFFT